MAKKEKRPKKKLLVSRAPFGGKKGKKTKKLLVSRAPFDGKKEKKKEKKRLLVSRAPFDGKKFYYLLVIYFIFIKKREKITSCSRRIFFTLDCNVFCNNLIKLTFLSSSRAPFRGAES